MIQYRWFQIPHRPVEGHALVIHPHQSSGQPRLDVCHFAIRLRHLIRRRGRRDRGPIKGSGRIPTRAQVKATRIRPVIHAQSLPSQMMSTRRILHRRRARRPSASAIGHYRKRLTITQDVHHRINTSHQLGSRQNRPTQLPVTVPILARKFRVLKKPLVPRITDSVIHLAQTEIPSQRIKACVIVGVAKRQIIVPNRQRTDFAATRFRPISTQSVTVDLLADFHPDMVFNETVDIDKFRIPIDGISKVGAVERGLKPIHVTTDVGRLIGGR